MSSEIVDNEEHPTEIYYIVAGLPGTDNSTLLNEAPSGNERRVSIKELYRELNNPERKESLGCYVTPEEYLQIVEDFLILK